MTVLLNVTANASENENAVFLVQAWPNGIVEAFDDGNCGGLPIRATDPPRCLGKLQGLEGWRRYFLQLMPKLQYGP